MVDGHLTKNVSNNAITFLSLLIANRVIQLFSQIQAFACQKKLKQVSNECSP